MHFNHAAVPDIPEIAAIQRGNKRYYKIPSGTYYPSITTILGAKEKPWLKNWTQMLGEDKAAKETKRCAVRGTAVHAMAERYLNNEPYPAFTKEYSFDHVPDFNQLRTHLNHINNIRGQEVALFSDDMRVAGRVDCIGEYDGVLSIIDFKTSNNSKDREMIGDYFKQGAAYAIMWHELTGEKIDDIVILMSVEKGMVPLLFKEKVEDHIEPLVRCIIEYHNSVNHE